MPIRPDPENDAYPTGYEILVMRDIANITSS
jgi:hypothetical protein